MAINFRPTSFVKQDFNLLGVTVKWLARRRLARMDEKSYQNILGLVKKISSETVIDRLKVGKPGNLSPETIEAIPVPVVGDHFISGTFTRVLDLRGIEEFWMRKKADEAKQKSLRPSGQVSFGFPERESAQVVRLLDVIAEERAYFDRLAKNPQATVDKVFRAIDHGKRKLGFLNVNVYRPLENGRWICTQRTRQWGSSGISKYDPESGGSFPETTLKSVIRAKGAVLEASIDDPKTFEKEGLYPDIESIHNDLKESKGPARMLFIRLVSSSGKIEAVIQLHNRVGISEPVDPPPFLPADPADARRVKTELAMYFSEAVRAIEAIRAREQMRQAPRASERKDQTDPFFNNVQFHGSSELRDYLGLQIESNANPALNFARIEERVIEKLSALAEACVGEKISYQEMKEHVILVSQAEIVRERDEIVGFGTSRYFDNYVNQLGKKEKLTLLWGTMVRPDFRRKGLMIKLNFDLIKAAKEAVRNSIRGLFKMFRRLWVPAPITVRTQSRAVLEACARHFSGVSRIGEKTAPRYQHMTEFVAGEERWELDSNNIQKNAYDRMRLDKESDLVPGLGPRDAYVFSGDFTLWKEFLTWVALKIIYPLKIINRGKRSGKNNPALM